MRLRSFIFFNFNMSLKKALHFITVEILYSSSGTPLLTQVKLTLWVSILGELSKRTTPSNADTHVIMSNLVTFLSVTKLFSQ